ncbi:YggS family pyridoxal phosphate-dependent enzyme, partial [Clostridium perfringens]|nr:YggS family pyridoxal phosphate-dependent enzyme [Clostridium perfringens]
IYDELSKNSYKNISMEILSMGMTNDYKIAIEEGANLIRVGEGIFGKRNTLGGVKNG